MSRYLVLSVIGFFFLSCQSTKNMHSDLYDENGLFDKSSFQANMTFLASDELQGRETGTQSDKIASAFLASELRKYGVQPFLANGQYFQNIELRQIKFSEKSSFCLINEKEEEILSLRYGEDFTGSTRYYQSMDTTTQIVFVGYGITAAEFNYDDYENIDVSGKLVLFISGEPSSDDSTYFKGAEASPYASIRSKTENAKKRGASGAVYVSTWEEQYGWKAIVSFVEKGHLQLLDEPVKKADNNLPVAIISDSTLRSVLAITEFTYQELQHQLDLNQPLPVFEIKPQAKIHWAFDTTGTIQTRNVLGVIEGVDPQLQTEYVSIGAHFDHEGIGLNGIYNGADDNASGTVAVLEIAKALARTRENKRSALIAFYTAEEKGLLGSKYLAESLENIDDIIVNINLDMIGRGATDSIYSLGSDRLSSELRELIEEVNERTVTININYQLDQPNDPMRLFYRSDQYNFAKKEVPVAFFFDNEFEDYHKVTDDAEKINFAKLQKVARLAFEIMIAVANRESGFKVPDGQTASE